jgi:signal transduction histidine kinase
MRWICAGGCASGLVDTEDTIDEVAAIEDSGAGFDTGAGERIFDSMFTAKSGGIGMGLSISRSIIAAHGDRIWASPGESVGAIFRIVLPSERSVEGDQIR